MHSLMFFFAERISEECKTIISLQRPSVRPSVRPFACPSVCLHSMFSDLRRWFCV